MKTKKELRKEILSRRKAMTEEEARVLSRAICSRVAALEVYAKATDLCIYMPIRREVDLTGLIEPARACGKRVWIPKVTGQTIVFNAYAEELMRTGAYDIMESASEEVLEPDGGTLILMPGSVFDIRRNRIGYGGGYYDRYLEKFPMCRTAAVCYDFQIVESLPAEAHDRRPEWIVSEKRTLGAGEG